MSTDTAAWLRGLPVLTGTAPGPTSSGWPAEPDARFLRWLGVAVDSGVAEPHVAVLSTVDDEGVPDARALIVRDVDERGWAFAGPRSSAKGTQLAAHPVAALTFWWQPIVRSVRVRGHVIAASEDESAADFAGRSAAARADVPTGDWRLWRLVPERIEFWQGEIDRRHIRHVYTRTPDAQWSVSATRGGEPIPPDIP